MPDWFTIPRALSLLIALTYLVLVCVSAPSAAKLFGGLLIFGGALLFPLACIWFADELGEYVGALPGPAINRKSPAWMVKIGGWVLLLLPPVISFFAYR